MTLTPEIIDGIRVFRLNEPDPDNDITIHMTTKRFDRQMVEAIGRPAIETVLVLAKVMSWNKDDTDGLAQSVRILTPNVSDSPNDQEILANLYRVGGSGLKIDLMISINFGKVSFINSGQCLIAMPEVAAIAAVKKKVPIHQIVALPQGVEVDITRWSTSRTKLVGTPEETCLLRGSFSDDSRSPEDIMFIGTPPLNYP